MSAPGSTGISVIIVNQSAAAGAEEPVLIPADASLFTFSINNITRRSRRFIVTTL